MANPVLGVSGSCLWTAFYPPHKPVKWRQLVWRHTDNVADTQEQNKTLGAHGPGTQNPAASLLWVPWPGNTTLSQTTINVHRSLMGTWQYHRYLLLMTQLWTDHMTGPLGIPQGLVPRSPMVPKSLDAQVLYLKQCSICVWHVHILLYATLNHL